MRDEAEVQGEGRGGKGAQAAINEGRGMQRVAFILERRRFCQAPTAPAEDQREEPVHPRGHRLAGPGERRSPGLLKEARRKRRVHDAGVHAEGAVVAAVALGVPWVRGAALWGLRGKHAVGKDCMQADRNEAA